MTSINPHYQGPAKVIKESPLTRVAIVTGLVAITAGTLFALHIHHVSGFQNMHFQAAYIPAATAGTVSTLALLTLGFSIFHKKHVSEQPFPKELDDIQEKLQFTLDEFEYNEKVDIRKVTVETEENATIKGKFFSAMRKFWVFTPVKKWLMAQTAYKSNPASYLTDGGVSVTQVALPNKPDYEERFSQPLKQPLCSKDPFTYADGEHHAYPIYGNGNVFGGSSKGDGGAQEEMVNLQAPKLFFLDYLFASYPEEDLPPRILLPQGREVDANGHPTNPTPVLIEAEKEYDIKGIYGTEKMWTRNIAGLSSKARPALMLIGTIALASIALAVMHNMGVFQHHQTLNMLTQTKILLPSAIGLTVLAIGVLAGIARLRYPKVIPIPENEQQTVTLFNIAARDYKTHPKEKYEMEDLEYHYDALVAAFEGLKAQHREDVVIHMSDWGTGVFLGSRNTMVTLILAAARTTGVQLQFDMVSDSGDYSQTNIIGLKTIVGMLASPKEVFEKIINLGLPVQDRGEDWQPRKR